MNFAQGERVRWVPDRKADWAGDGAATVRVVDSKRLGWGATLRDAGPAVEIVLDYKSQSLWVPPTELMALL